MALTFPTPACQRELVNGHSVLNLVDRPTSIVSVLQESLKQYGSRVLLNDPALGQVVTYGRFAELVEGAAASLAGRCQPGDRVAVLARNGLEIAIAIWACARADLIFVGLPVDLPAAKLDELVKLTTPTLVLAQAEFSEVLAESIDINQLIAQGRPWNFGRDLPDQDAVYALIATSGTTGRSKAVKITGRMAGHAAAYYGAALGLTAGDGTAIHLSFAWVSGHITQLCPTMYTGGSVVTMATFSPKQLIDVVAAHGITWIDVVPSIWEGLLRAEHFDGASLPTLRLAVFGGAPAPPGTLDRVRQRVPAVQLLDVYAQSETCAPVTILPDEEAEAHGGTVGRPSPFSEIEIVDGAGVPVARDHIGQLRVRSGSVTPGYWPPDVAPVTDDGWFQTGDLAALDADGYLTTHGRSVDLIIRGGRNIFPAEVERALMSTGLLADAAVVGLPSVVGGQSVAAAVAPLPGVEVITSVLRELVSAAIGNHAVPRVYCVVEDLPRNRNGKVDRTAVLELFQ